MSKTTLRKELAAMSHEQLEEIIMEAYSRRPEIKEYFEFFLNPDVRKLFEKYMKVVEKELGRVKWRMSKARVTVMKRAVSTFISFGPPPEDILEFMRTVLASLGTVDRHLDLTPSQERYVEFLTRQMLAYGDEMRMADVALGKLAAVTGDVALSRRFKRLVSDAIADR